MSSARFTIWAAGTIPMTGGVTFGGTAKKMPIITGPIQVTFGGTGVVNVRQVLSNIVTFTSTFGVVPVIMNTVTFTSLFTNNSPAAAGTNQVILTSRFSASDGDVASRRYRR